MQIKIKSFIEKNADVTDSGLKGIINAIKPNEGNGDTANAVSKEVTQYVDAKLKVITDGFDERIRKIQDDVSSICAKQNCIDEWLKTVGFAYGSACEITATPDMPNLLTNLFNINHKFFLPFLMVYTYTHVNHLADEWSDPAITKKALIDAGFNNEQIDQILDKTVLFLKGCLKKKSESE